MKNKIKKILGAVIGGALLLYGIILCLSVTHYYVLNDHLTYMQVFKMFFGRIIFGIVVATIGQSIIHFVVEKK